MLHVWKTEGSFPLRLVEVMLWGTVGWLLVPASVEASTGRSQESHGSREALVANALERADVGAAHALIEQNADINAAQPDGTTALHWAAHHELVKVADLLIERKATVQCENRYGSTPIVLACETGNSRMVQLLLEAGADPNSELPGGETALMTAARTGSVDVIKALLAAGANVDARERQGQTALMWASAEGNLGAVRALVEADADPGITLASGFTAMFFAVRAGRTDVVRFFLQTGRDVNAAMFPEKTGGKNVLKGTSPLILAIENGHFELAIELLRQGADPNDQRTGFAPLHTLSWVRKPPIGDNADGDPPPSDTGQTTSLQFVRKLVEFGADVNLGKSRKGGRGKYGHEGTTPFLCAAGTADVPFMQCLLELGANPRLANDRGWTPLMMAAGIGTGSSGDSAGTEDECYQAVEFLLGLGLDVNHVDKHGETTMHAAAYKMMPSVVQLLAENGADISIWNNKSKQGRTPLNIARGFRGGGNFKPSYETVAAITDIMTSHGVEIPPPPAPVIEKGYKAN